MVAYAVFIRDRLREPDTMESYYEKVSASFEGQPIIRRAYHGALEMLEGPPMESAVIFEFPDITAARSWYDSPAYREARRFRHMAADYRVFIVEGV